MADRRMRTSIDKEVLQLDAQIQTLARKEADFQRLLGDLQKLKDEATNERLGYITRKNDLEAQKEPINWMPTELLMQIFLAFGEFDFEDPHYRPPVIVSHVCTKWRAIALSTPRLWSRITLQGFKQPEMAQSFFIRSAESPLEINYSSSPDARPTDECFQTVDLLAKTSMQFYRAVALSFRSKVALPIVYLLPSINDFINTFPRLQHLTLAISTANPLFVEAPSLMDREDAILNTKKPTIHQSGSSLLHLALEQVPLFNFPTAFVANLRTLDLSYSPRKINSTRHDYHLKMSSLCRFLALTPLLEELVLNNTVPYFDVALPKIDGGSEDSPDAFPLIRMHPVKLDCLKSVDWTYPYTGDVPRFLSMIDAPGLEKLDLWVQDLPVKRTDVLHTRGYHASSSAHKYVRGIVSYPSLRDLSLQCAGEDTTACVLRKFSLPALEAVAFTNVDISSREVAGGGEPPLPVFPRLESIFRDPRLPNLTHLTISHFKFSLEPGRAESVLGYMLALVSLSLDSCVGAGRLIEGLQERFAVGTIRDPTSASGAVGKSRSRRGVRHCPRLEALSFRGCHDVGFDILSAVVLARNGMSTDNIEHEAGLKAASVPNGEIPGGITRMEEVSRDVIKKEGGGHTSGGISQVGRRIKPLRKSRHHIGSGLGSPSPSSSLAPSMNILSTLKAMQEAFEPAHIVCLRVVNCKLVEQDHAASLRDFGVVDVIWGDSG